MLSQFTVGGTITSLRAAHWFIGKKTGRKIEFTTACDSMPGTRYAAQVISAENACIGNGMHEWKLQMFLNPRKSCYNRQV
jgi:hypothetical protein